MELEAKAIQILPVQSGTSKTGKQWQCQELITETLGNYPKKVKLKFFGDKPMEALAKVRAGQTYIFHIDIESREFNGRWYTDVTCYRITDSSQSNQNQPQTYTPPAPYGTSPQSDTPTLDAMGVQGYQQRQTAQQKSQQGEADDLPF